MKSAYGFILLLVLTVLACGPLGEQPVPTLVPTADEGVLAAAPEDIPKLDPTFTTLPTNEFASTPAPDNQDDLSTPTPVGTIPTNTPIPTPTIPTPTPSETPVPSVTPTLTNTPSHTVTPNGSGGGSGGGSGATNTPNPQASNTPAAPGPTNTPGPWYEPTPHGHPVSTIRKGFDSGIRAFDDLNLGGWRHVYSRGVDPNYQVLQQIPRVASGPDSGVLDLAHYQMTDERTPHDYWLVFNECEHQFQCNTAPEAAAEYYHDVIIDLIYTQGGDPNAKLIVGGVNAQPCGIEWLERFVNHYEANYGPVPRAGWHFHLYPEIRPSQYPSSCSGGWIFDDTLFPNPTAAFELWRSHALNTLAFVQEYGVQTDEIWFTEMGCINYGSHQVPGPICQADGFMYVYAPLIFDWLNNEGRWVTRFGWWADYAHDFYAKVTMLYNTPPASYEAGVFRDYSEMGLFYQNMQAATSIPLPWP